VKIFSEQEPSSHLSVRRAQKVFEHTFTKADIQSAAASVPPPKTKYSLIVCFRDDILKT
jgi:hypothetical protein